MSETYANSKMTVIDRLKHRGVTYPSKRCTVVIIGDHLRCSYLPAVGAEKYGEVVYEGNKEIGVFVIKAAKGSIDKGGESTLWQITDDIMVGDWTCGDEGGLWWIKLEK